MAKFIEEEALCFYTTQIFCCRNMLCGCRPSVDKMVSVPWFNSSNRYRAFQRSNYIICRVLWTLIPFSSINIFLQTSIVNYLYVLLRKRNVHTTRHSHGRYIVITQLCRKENLKLCHTLICTASATKNFHQSQQTWHLAKAFLKQWCNERNPVSWLVDEINKPN
jgi:hypothetical protein